MGSGIVALLGKAINKSNVVIRPFDGFIFLCGGTIDGSSEDPASAREYALNRADSAERIAGHRVIIAEKMTSLMEGDDFNDLLEFEEHIAALCACVLIFVESPGSIAELGSFSVMRHLAPKLLVVCEQRFEADRPPSFIFLGPIASLKRRRAESVQVFPIMADTENGFLPDRVLLDDCWEYIEEALGESLKRPIPESKLIKGELSHQMVLVASLIDLSVAIKLGEIESILEGFEIELSNKALRRILRMLEKFQLVSPRTYGNETFYHSRLQRSLVSFRPAPESQVPVFDGVRFKSDAVRYYAEQDPRRAKAIKAFLRDNGT